MILPAVRLAVVILIVVVRQGVRPSSELLSDQTGTSGVLIWWQRVSGRSWEVLVVVPGQIKAPTSSCLTQTGASGALIWWGRLVYLVSIPAESGGKITQVDGV